MNRVTATIIIILIPVLCWCKDFYRDPTKLNSKVVQMNASLITRDPTNTNYETYYQLAQSLWELKRNEEAKNMFQKIIQSTLPQYNTTYIKESDLKDDTSKVYAYGSYTVNYKNSSSLYLTKILIEQEKYAEALTHLEAADTLYSVIFTCGTGESGYNREIRNLYGLCYEGLGQIQKSLDSLLPYCFEFDNMTIIRILKKNYSQEEIKRQMEIARNSINCVVDTVDSESYITVNEGTKKEKTRKVIYKSGKGSIVLFGRQIDLPEPMLKNKEIVTRKHFVDDFLSSRFYRELTEIESN